ncbi:stage III sporulation protein AC [Tepidibacillus fermentans]|uniref:Stage III sporulation protein AC n=1 Tax=Tepidibacillus fermentans TaxID=1281767 RepID=A0A4R3KJS2_9BACI|nr:stage III sporulation protein AC [Tepidibacillus fermentans]TCS84025.1 stage III sporulation protein AC [Tepidibacillus fermentans]
MNFDVNTIFQIAGIGIILSMITTILKQMDKKEVADWVTLIGFVVILYMVATLVNDLFQEIQRVFLFH